MRVQHSYLLNFSLTSKTCGTALYNVRRDITSSILLYIMGCSPALGRFFTLVNSAYPVDFIAYQPAPIPMQFGEKENCTGCSTIIAKGLTVFGILNVDKPQAMTSRDVVNVVQRLIRPVKVGHAGTLDPLATGVLVLPVGRATRLTELIHSVSKTYIGTFELGKVSDTEDIEGEVISRDISDIPDPENVQAVVSSFAGIQQQMPPAYSALKVNGMRAYDLARSGQKVELKSRQIQVFRIEVLVYEFPVLIIEIECSSGTYIRSLGRDIGEQLQTGAVMTALQRTRIGHFEVEQAVAPDFNTVDAVAAALRNPLDILSGFHRTVLHQQQQEELYHGRRIELQDVPDDLTLGVSANQQLLSVLQRVNDTETFKPTKNFFID
ncbi:MAG: tRNA pseudouridine(55) synthase TruB [Planctomycetaceae bacterium]|nr:tRNA pseudouridine(55) synthase TruB [Planctomycetaceae bacterium]